VSLLLKLAPDDARPLYRQIATAVRRALAEGDLVPGERLPAGRDLADALGLGLDTVQRAYRLLADEGLVVSRVGRGTQVRADLRIEELELLPQVERLVERARRLGVGVDELATLVRRVAAHDAQPG
jgi:DNA-binding transcriptional regulator YhcF (GntR family)